MTFTVRQASTNIHAILIHNPDDLLNWGWHEATYDASFSCDFRDDLGINAKNRIGTALAALGLSPLPVGSGGDNECHSIEHFDETLLDADGEQLPIQDQHYRINDRSFPATGAYYRFAINKKGAAIFAQNFQKPSVAAAEHLEHEIAADDLPHLSRASDILWAYWSRNNDNPRGVYYYFVNYVRNEQTLPLVARALRNRGLDKVPYWPGLRMQMHEDEAEVILGEFPTFPLPIKWCGKSWLMEVGSPMGSTIAHFLLQHKGALGIKNFESVTIFRDNYPETSPGAQEVQLLFKIIDVPRDEVDDSDEEMPDAVRL